MILRTNVLFIINLKGVIGIMKEIYICTNDTILQDLLIAGIQENFNSIIDELVDNACVIINGNYILGEVTAAYLKLQYNINSAMYSIE